MKAEYTVVIPTWNRARTLPRAIYSALCQTLPPLEVLVCDDGSNDESEQVVRQFGNPVRWCPGERGGRPAIPRNRGIKESRGEWVAFLDSDDQWLPQKMEKQFTALRKSGCLASSTNAYRYVPGATGLSILLSTRAKSLSFADLLDVNLVICSSALVHRSLFEKASGFPEDKALTALEDYSLWLRIAALTRFSFVDEPLLVYLDDPASSVRNWGLGAEEQRKAVFGNFREWAESYGMAERINQTEARWSSNHRAEGFAKCLMRAKSLLTNIGHRCRKG